MLIFEIGAAGRTAEAHCPPSEAETVLADLPPEVVRTAAPLLPEVSELQTVRHYTCLSRRNYAIDTCFYPLGSCTMKYNPRGAHRAAMHSGFSNHHPLSPEAHSQGTLACLHDVQEALREITGMAAVSLTPMAGAQGEFAGVAMIRAYHDARGDHGRREILIPAAAHGTNPATAAMCGCKVREIGVDASGDVNIEDLRAAVGEHTAGLMMTNPSTCGIFERRIAEIASIMHTAGGLLYYDGANLNAILGRVRPGDMGFDVLHLNLHKTFATPHGGGGPGSGSVAANEQLAPYLPIPMVGLVEQAGKRRYGWLDAADRPHSIGRLSTFHGNTGILIRALAYILMLGREGLRRVSDHATLNANYLATRLAAEGFELAYPQRRASHEFIITFKQLARTQGVTALDMAKRLLDYGIHAPTIYFPLLIPECFLIEPTETETKEELDRFVEALIRVREEARCEPELVRKAPWKMPVRRLDEVHAARRLDLCWRPDQGDRP